MQRVSDDERRVEVYPPIYKLGVAGKWLRKQFMNGEFLFATHERQQFARKMFEEASSNKEGVTINYV